MSDGPGPSLAWSDLLDAIAGVDPRTIQAVFGALGEDQLKQLGSRISSEPSGSDFYQFVLNGASKDQITSLSRLWAGHLRPDGGNDWYSPGGQLFGTTHGNTFIGAKQGSLDDCWMLAKLNALVGADPNWPHEHVRRNGNGTVSVKFYNGDGDPYWVTVTEELPGNGADPESSTTGTWAAYYEKAMASDPNGEGGLMPGQGYEGLTAGFSDSADEYLTGHESDNLKFGHWPWSDDPHDAVVKAHDDGKGVVAENWSNQASDGDDDDDDMRQWHVYYVKDIEANGDVVLGNPWGHSDVTLTRDEFNDYMEDVSIVNQ